MIPILETRTISELARAADATPFVSVAVALTSILARQTGETQIVIGIQGRQRLPLCIAHDGRAGFVPLLHRVRDAMVEALDHELPFETLLAALAPAPVPGAHPIFQVALDVTGRGASAEPDPASYDLSITVGFEPDGWILDATYAAALFDLASVDDLLEQIALWLEQAARSPDAPVGTFSLVTATAARELPDPTAVLSDRFEGAAHERFSARAARAPDHVAIRDGDEIWTYGELERRSNQLAHRLRAAGLGIGDTVAIGADRSGALVWAMLGVMKSGATFCALDPAYPDARLVQLIRLLAPRAWLRVGACPEPSAAVLDALAPTAILALALPGRPGAAGAPTDDQPSTAPAVSVGPDDVAYIAFTSGSTGIPKGVLGRHGSLSHFVPSLTRAFGYVESDRFSMLSGLAHDPLHRDTLLPLQVGATICVPDREAMERPGRLAGWMHREGITVCHLTPAMNQILTAPATGSVQPRLDSLRLVTFLGEALTRRDTRLLRPLASNAMFVNSYGATETQRAVANFVVVDDVSDRDRPAHEVYPVGTGIEDVQVLVINPEGRRAGVAELGEIWFRSPHLALGYLRDETLSQQRFCPNPVSGDPADRAYRTGDLGRYRPGGDVVHAGRSDSQIKVRGFRIELGEIEAVLHRHPHIRTALVVARDDRASGKTLVAYVCTSQRVPTAELRGLVTGLLPDYMVPAAFVVLDELPRTPSGKLDRNALPAPTEDDFERADYVAPRTEVEIGLAKIWCDVLGIERIGIHDNFFALGGHSLRVVRLVARISGELDVELLPRVVFESPTIAEQAERVSAQARADAMTADPSIERALTEIIAALSAEELTSQLAEWSPVMLEPVKLRPSCELIGERRALLATWLAQHRIDSRPSHPLAPGARASGRATLAEQLLWDVHQRGNFPALGVHAAAFAIRGRLDPAVMQRAIAALVHRQSALRTTFDDRRGVLTRTVRDEGPTLDITDLGAYAADEREERARAMFREISRPHDLGSEVFRAQLVRFDDEDHRLFLVPHHIVLDGFSWDVLNADLAAIYRGLAAGNEPDLVPLVLEYKDFCFWQTTLEDRPLGRRQLEFWARAVADYPGLEIPGDRDDVPRGAIGMALDTYANGAAPFALDGDRWQALERTCARLACTPYSVIATGFLLLLTRWAGRNDACILSGNFHRNRPGSEAVIGNFVTPYPMRIAFDEDATLEQAVRRCHEAVLVHREQGHVAARTAVDAWPEWSRYNLNYLIDPFEQEALDFGTVTAERVYESRTDWSANAQRTPHDLGLFVRQRAGGIRGSLVYNAERFSPELAGRAAVRIGELIDAITTSSSDRVSSLPRTP